MTTVDAANVHNIAIEGTFDDCQDLVKALFADAAFRDRARAVGGELDQLGPHRGPDRLLRLGRPGAGRARPRKSPSPCRPAISATCWRPAARHMGLPIASLAIGTNRNDILTRFLETGSHAIGTVEPSLSPSMDIQVSSSNFERLMFELFDRDGAALTRAMADFRRDGTLALSPAQWQRARAGFAGFRLDDAGTLATIRRVWQATGEILDPHSAIGVATAEACHTDPSVPMVALACAHPAKFPDAVERATGIRPALPGRLSDLLQRPERMSVLPNDLATIEAFVAERATGQGIPA
jgi:threonine synthase